MSSPDARHRLIANARYEVVPLKSLHDQIPHLPAGSSVSVTCSPTKGIEPTLELSAELNGAGHHAVPHIAARLVEGREHVEKIAARLNEHEISEIFVVGGDPDPIGPYRDGLSLMRDLLPLCQSVRTVGVPAYPDHHTVIPDAALDEALLAKQAMITEMGLVGFASTQMCFNAKTIEHWLRRQRDRGMNLPIHLGVPGVVERTKLLSLGTRLGIGSSLRYLRKNSGAIVRMFSPSSYDPNKLIAPMSRHADELGITALHVFTFNSIESTAAWQRKSLG
ncbi:MAG: methylenetetrahydrofolate reductase [Ilumatobacteraceae bacterium]|jgi:methylenetetrahydrofolate reductase (NADPH)